MVDAYYNPSIDNYDNNMSGKEPPRMNPSNMIANFTQPQPSVLRRKIRKLRLIKMQNKINKQSLKFNSKRIKSIFKQKNQFKRLVPIRRNSLYPLFTSPTQMKDIDYSFNGADIGHGEKSLWGNEKYFDENFYDEDFFGKEFDNSPFFHIQVKPRAGVSPLMW